ncbi:MAG: hypothetical protein JHD07_24585 [Bradyrhizobium sp.]|jgi:hypothetical protein|uniref:PDC sensor domain-containing protein n=1 Tax=Bradyrhizobium TaxID=374 RepID=UPI00040A75F4|nr:MULTISPECIES: cache domain-containing protein [Bradyrhizobium]MBJ7406302.1 hypothetical protein [Bradyrhizobium sp.]
MAGVAEMLAYCKPDRAERLNGYLASTVRSLPQLREIKVLDARGDAVYSSALPISGHNNADREYFRYNESHAGPELMISGPFSSRTTCMPTIVLSRRITNAANGEFVGVVMASILTDYFGNFYRAFGIAEHGGVILITGEGRAPVHLPSGPAAKTFRRLTSSR